MRRGAGLPDLVHARGTLFLCRFSSFNHVRKAVSSLRRKSCVSTDVIVRKHTRCVVDSNDLTCVTMIFLGKIKYMYNQILSVNFF